MVNHPTQQEFQVQNLSIYKNKTSKLLITCTTKFMPLQLNINWKLIQHSENSTYKIFHFVIKTYNC